MRENPVILTSFHGRAPPNLSRRRIAAGGQAGGRRLAASSSNVGANRNGNILLCTYVLWELLVLGPRTDSGASTPPTSGVELEPSGTENASRPALPDVAGSRDGGQFMADQRLSGVCRPSTKILDRISSEASHRRFFPS